MTYLLENESIVTSRQDIASPLSGLEIYMFFTRAELLTSVPAIVLKSPPNFLSILRIILIVFHFIF